MKLDSNMFTNDWSLFYILIVTTVIMIHQNLRLGKCWKLFRAFFNKSIV